MNWHKFKLLATRAVNGLPIRSASFDRFLISAAEARTQIGDPTTDLERFFLETTSPSVIKWLHYLPLYERYFGPFRGKPIRMLEIGILNGGSIALWRRFFGPDAIIFGIDINPECAEKVFAPNQARIGSQADADFLRRTVEEMGGIDIILDDGSHVAGHQKASFEALFPLLADGGLYVVEDLHTAYWPDIFDGGYRRPGTAIEEAKKIVDDMHHWYHPHNFSTAARDMVTGVHFHDSIVVVEKGQQSRPGLARIGTDEVASKPFVGGVQADSAPVNG